MKHLKSVVSLVIAILGVTICLIAPGSAAYAEQNEPQTLSEVRFYAWAGSAEVNAYIEWAKHELAKDHAIDLKHIKVADISEAVTLLLADATEQTSAVDLLWINGENFAALKQANKLVGNLQAKVPNSRLLRKDLAWQIDFGTPVEGFELPWGIAQLQLIVRDIHLRQKQAIVSPEALLDLAKTHPERFSYPKPPSFHGTSWLKALAFQLAEHPEMLTLPATDARAKLVLAPLWRYLDKLHPHLWQQGREFPISAGRQRQLYNQGVLDNSITFNPNEVKALQVQHKLSADARSVSLGERALTNFHYLAIPASSQRKAAALKVINFFLSVKAQGEKARADGWADPSVVRLNGGDSKAQHTLVANHPEPHVSWNAVLEREWLARYQR